jgi:hypothetical protein
MIANIKLLLGGVVMALVGGCATPAPGWIPVAFDDGEYSAFQKTGTGTVKGQVFAKTRGGDVKKGAGNEVYLMPATKYGEQRYRESLINGQRPAINPDPRHAKFVLTKITDGEGRFEFTNIAPGKYYAYSTITWEVPSKYSLTGMSSQGGLVAIPVEVKDGVVFEAMLKL